MVPVKRGQESITIEKLVIVILSILLGLALLYFIYKLQKRVVP